MASAVDNPTPSPPSARRISDVHDHPQTIPPKDPDKHSSRRRKRGPIKLTKRSKSISVMSPNSSSKQYNVSKLDSSSNLKTDEDLTMSSEPVQQTSKHNTPRFDEHMCPEIPNSPEEINRDEQIRLHKYEEPLEEVDQSLLAFSAVSYCTASPGSDTALPEKTAHENNCTDGSGIKGNDNATISHPEQQQPKLKSIMKAPFSSADRRPNSVATELSSKKSVTFEEIEPTAKEKRDQSKGSHLSVISCKLFKGLVLRPGNKSDQVPSPNRFLKNFNDNNDLGMDLGDNYQYDDQVQAYSPEDRISMEQQCFEPDHQSPPDDERSSNMDEVVESSLRLKGKQLEQLKRKTSENAFLLSSSPTTSLNSLHCVNKKPHLPINTPNQRQSSIGSNAHSKSTAMTVRKTRNAIYDPSGMLDIHQIDSQLKLLKKKKREIRKQTASNYLWKLFGWSGSKETNAHSKKQLQPEKQHDWESNPASILSFEDEHGTGTSPGANNPLSAFLSNELQPNNNNGTGTIIHHFNGNNNKVGIGIGISTGQLGAHSHPLSGSGIGPVGLSDDSIAGNYS
ncbi:unnamed protein product [Ambrosiozyma monospora]|uniref:Unnamed protein product n=1 Tax=Ambrosiozyma monospora TaxID=43982 RepID=A0A9W7DFY3_AMBMO|nr:unnamed protein product [Ambrosiozyma monospora]